MKLMTFDVFISYNRDDELEVIELAKKLKDRGLNVWLDLWELSPGSSFQKALEEMIKIVNAVAIVIGSSGIGPWQNIEMNACLVQFAERGMTVIPIILSNAQRVPELPLFLKGFTWLDFRKN